VEKARDREKERERVRNRDKREFDDGGSMDQSKVNIVTPAFARGYAANVCL
jgi:hypothetical protein